MVKKLAEMADFARTFKTEQGVIMKGHTPSFEFFFLTAQALTLSHDHEYTYGEIKEAQAIVDAMPVK